jgi:hypothetical protein
MTLDTFFKKFDQFADAPDAVAKMRYVFSPNGATHHSLGHRPRKSVPTEPRALKGRTMVARANNIPIWLAPTGLHPLLNPLPRALPWAAMNRPFGVEECTS